MKLDELNHALFAPYVQQSFRVEVTPDQWLELTLVGVRPIQRRAATPGSVTLDRDPFALLFCGPLQTPLEQKMYHFEQASLGRIENLFIAPVGLDQIGRYYEAVFN